MKLLLVAFEDGQSLGRRDRLTKSPVAHDFLLLAASSEREPRRLIQVSPSSVSLDFTIKTLGDCIVLVSV